MVAQPGGWKLLPLEAALLVRKTRPTRHAEEDVEASNDIAADIKHLPHSLSTLRLERWWRAVSPSLLAREKEQTQKPTKNKQTQLAPCGEFILLSCDGDETCAWM